MTATFVPTEADKALRANNIKSAKSRAAEFDARPPREAAINDIVRSAVSQVTGALTNVERAGSSDDHWLGVDEEWAVLCVSHGEFVGVDSRKEAWLTSTHPELFCRLCGMIAAGKFHKITR